MAFSRDCDTNVTIFPERLFTFSSVLPGTGPGSTGSFTYSSLKGSGNSPITFQGLSKHNSLPKFYLFSFLLSTILPKSRPALLSTAREQEFQSQDLGVDLKAWLIPELHIHFVHYSWPSGAGAAFRDCLLCSTVFDTRSCQLLLATAAIPLHFGNASLIVGFGY